MIIFWQSVCSWDDNKCSERHIAVYCSGQLCLMPLTCCHSVLQSNSVKCLAISAKVRGQVGHAEYRLCHDQFEPKHANRGSGPGTSPRQKSASRPYNSSHMHAQFDWQPDEMITIKLID